MEIRKDERVYDEFNADGRWTVIDDGTEVSSGGVNTRASRYMGSYIKTMLVGGVGTPVEYRRRGYVRRFFDNIGVAAPEKGWAVSMLHPFSRRPMKRENAQRQPSQVLMSVFLRLR